MCRKLLLRAEGRRYGKTVVIAKNLKVSEDEDDDDEEESDDGDAFAKNFSDEEMEANPAKKAKRMG